MVRLNIGFFTKFMMKIKRDLKFHIRVAIVLGVTPAEENVILQFEISYLRLLNITVFFAFPVNLTALNLCDFENRRNL